MLSLESIAEFAEGWEIFGSEAIDDVASSGEGACVEYVLYWFLVAR